MTTLKVAQEVLERFSHKETSVRGAINWALIYENQKLDDVLTHTGQACFANLGGQKEGAKYFIFWNFYRRRFGDYGFDVKELTTSERAYIKYIVKDSVFAPCFQTKSIKKIFERGIVLKTDKPAQFVYSAATSIRYVSEYPDIPKLWDKFRKYLTKDEAFILAHLFASGNNAKKYLSHPYWSSQHKWTVGPSVFGKNEFKRFCDRNLEGLKDRPSFSEQSNFRGVADIWKDKPGNIRKNKQFIWVGGEEKVMGSWTQSLYREYDYENLKHDIKATREANRV